MKKIIFESPSATCVPQDTETVTNISLAFVGDRIVLFAFFSIFFFSFILSYAQYLDF